MGSSRVGFLVWFGASSMQLFVLLAFNVAAASAALISPLPKSETSNVRRREAVSAAAATLLFGSANVANAAAPARKFYRTEGGVQYFDLEEGSCQLFNVACNPQKGDLVKIKYKAYLSNGRMFDSSEGPGRKPLAVTFGSGKLLPGWEEAISGGTGPAMKEGGTRVIQVPAELAYGEKGIKIDGKDGESEYLVPPNERLQFELTLVSVAAPPP